MNRKEEIIGILALLVIILAGFALALVGVGNPAGNIDNSYSSGDVLTGWINISLSDEPVSSKIEAFDSSMPLLNFLDANNADYTCSPSNCEQAFSAANERTSASFSLSSGSSKNLALKFTGEFSLVDDISFNLETNSAESCSTPLQIDFLNDGEIDWQYSEAGADFCQADYGCFNFSASTQDFIVSTQQYCEKINFSPVSRLRVGAYVKKTSGGSLTMSVYDSEKELLSTCPIPASEITSSFKEVYCDVNVSIPSGQAGYVCVATTSGAGYVIQGETSGENCGHYSIYSTTNNADYRIFSKPAKYKQGSLVAIANQTLSHVFLDIENYIADEYSNNCGEGCVIPFKVMGRTQQDVFLSNLQFKVISSGGLIISNKFYDTSRDSAKITMPLTILDIREANLEVPSGVNSTTATVYLGNDKILSESITVRRISTINKVYPLKVPVNFPVDFVAEITNAPGDAIKSYSWDFGSGVKTTSSNTISHTFSQKGNYTLNLKLVTAYGQKTKLFNISVESAKDAINYTLNLKEEKLSEFKTELDSHPLKSIIFKKINVVSLQSKLEELKLRYSIADTESEYTSLMAEITSLKIPESIEESLSLSGKLVPDFGSLSVSEIQEASPDSSSSGVYTQSLVESWYFSNLDTSLIEKKYSINYDDNTEEVVASFFNLDVVLKNNVPVHLLIKSPISSIEFSKNYNQKSQGSNTLIDLNSNSQLEFTISGNFGYKEIFIFPDLNTLLLEVSPCNSNGKCENEIGETKQNCREDCHSNLILVFFIILIISAAFIAYLFLQQWYKIKYETFLFKDRNYLFNLLNFINNAYKQKFTEQQIKNKLNKAGWTNEQAVYALKKYHGKETGMFDMFNILKNLDKFKPKHKPEIKRNIYNIKNFKSF